MRISSRLFAILLIVCVVCGGFLTACSFSEPKAPGGTPSGSGNTGASGSNGKGKKAEVLAIAKKYIGTPYRYGGQDPRGFDCSGYVLYVFRQAGVTLPHSAADQFAKLSSVKTPEPGDLVFFHTFGTGVSHVGIYAGGNTFLHSPTTGKFVEYADMRIDYWQKAYRGARTVF